MHRVGLVVAGDFQIMSSPRWRHSISPTSSPGKRSTRSVSSPSAAASCAALSALRSKPRDYRVRTTPCLSLVRRRSHHPANASWRICGAKPQSPSRASICTGAFVLAEAGLLDGRRATTHWLFTHELQARYPKVRVEEDRIFTHDGPVWTSAGMTAGIDLALALVEADLGVTSRGRSRKGWSCITGEAAHRGRNQHCSRWRRSRIEYRQHSRTRGRIFVRSSPWKHSPQQRISACVSSRARSDRRRASLPQGRRSAASRSRARDARRRLSFC